MTVDIPVYFGWLGIALLMSIVAALLACLWHGLRHAGFEGADRTTTWLATAVPLALWFAASWSFGVAGVFQARPDLTVPTIPFAIFLPVLVGLVLLLRSPRISAVLGVVPRSWLVGIQVYRIVGGVFLIFWSQGNLPGVFALPAGIGDILVGTLALPVAFYLRSQTSGARIAGYVWNLLGIVDLVVAVSTGFLTSPGPGLRLALDHPNLVATAYPVVMIPAFGVPLSFILHGLSLRQLLCRAGSTKESSSCWRSDGGSAISLTGTG